MYCSSWKYRYTMAKDDALLLTDVNKVSLGDLPNGLSV